MKNRITENKAFRISVIILVIALILVIAVMALLQWEKVVSIWDWALLQWEKVVSIWEFRFKATLGAPGDVDVYMIDIGPNVGLFYNTRARFCSDYHLKTKFKLGIHGVKTTAKYTGRATYIDGEIAYEFKVENPYLESEECVATGGYVKPGKELARVFYDVSGFDKKSDSEKEEITAKIAESYLGDLSEYTFTKFDIPGSKFYLYAKYIGNIQIEDYVLVNRTSWDRLVVDINTDDRNAVPNVDADELEEYVGSKMADYWENLKYNTGRVKGYESPYALSLHKDINGNLYVHGYMKVTLLWYDIDSESEWVYEFVVYLPE